MTIPAVPRRPKSPNDQAAVDAARAYLRSIGAAGTADGAEIGDPVPLTDTQRAERLAARAQTRAVNHHREGPDR